MRTQLAEDIKGQKEEAPQLTQQQMGSLVAITRGQLLADMGEAMADADLIEDERRLSQQCDSLSSTNSTCTSQAQMRLVA